MACIQITDLNSSDSEFLYELTDDEILDINGGGWFSRIVGVAMIVVGYFTTPVAIGTALIAGGASIINADRESDRGGNNR